MKPNKKWMHGTIGSISHGTMRKEDLIPGFCWELRYLGHRSKELSRIEQKGSDKYFESDESDYDLESLFDMLDEHSLPYMYFGAHPGDGADYGFWISESLEYDFDGLKVDDTESIPADYIGDVLVINEQELTLYYKSQRKLKEIWAVV